MIMRLGQEFSEYSKHLASLRNREEQRRVIAEIGKNDLYFLAKIILGYWWLTEVPHREFCREIQRDINLTLYLLPRGHCKTQCFTIADGIRQYLLDPEEPIAIVCDALKRSAKKTRAIKWQLENNIILKELYPDLLWANPQKESPKWTDEEFILPMHTGRQEPSFLAASLENQPTGLHFKRIKCDDIVTPETCTTKEQMDKNGNNYGLMRSSILQVGGNIQIAGTIYDDGDLHCEMSKEGSGYRVYKRPAIDPRTKRALWPEQFDIPQLDAIRKDPTVGDYIFSCQYLLDPSPEDEKAYFQLKWFPRYKELPKKLNYYCGIDFAVSERQTADHTAIIVAGIDPNNQTYIVHVEKGHWDSKEICDHMIDVQKTYNPLAWSCQGDIIRKVLGPFLRLQMRQANVWLNIDDSVSMKKDKVANARSIQGRIKEGAVSLPERSINQPDWLQDLEHELRRFPKGEHDDMIDAMAYIGIYLDNQVPADGSVKALKPLADIMIDAIEKDPEPTEAQIIYRDQVASDRFWNDEQHERDMIYDIR